MKRLRRFLFDECIGKPVMERIRQSLDSTAEFVHICDQFTSGALDKDWIPRLKSEECEYVVITADAGRQSKRGDKLPDLCRECGVTHVVLSSKLHQRESSFKQAALITVWDRLDTLHDAPRGSRYNLRFRSMKGDAVRTTIMLEPAKDSKTSKKKRPRKRGKDETGE